MSLSYGKKDGIPIMTYYKLKPERRGTLKNDGTFYRPKAPVIKNSVLLELDVIGTLEQHRAKKISFAIRNEIYKYGGLDIEVELEDFKAHSTIVYMGNPDKRKQYLYSLPEHFKREQQSKQGSLF